MPTQKKTWAFRSGIVNPKYTYDVIHGDQSCTSCHGGVGGTADKAAAHTGMRKTPGASACRTCHETAANLADSKSLHTTLVGYETILAGRGFDLTTGSASRARYDDQCTRCHAAVAGSSPAEAACGQCHVSVPDGAGGGFVSGHRILKTPDMVNNCTACHGSRVKDEYYGQNNALYQRNRQYAPTYAASDGFGGATLQPDVHKTQGMACEACHSGTEMHGSGASTGIDRYGVTGRTQCQSCHTALSGTNAFHTSGHLSAMACQLCHAQPYKSCFSCHTQEKADGTAWFSSNGTDPTRAARQTPPAYSSAIVYVAGDLVTQAGIAYKSSVSNNWNHTPPNASYWTVITPTLPAGDSLMTFRAGRNPKFGQVGAPKYAVLRHVPVDADTFTYDEEGTSMPDLIPDLAGLPTWKYATPHNIARRTAVTTDPDGPGSLTACGNCHSDRYQLFWLTDPMANAHGWVPAGSTWEETANAGVVQPAPIAPTLP